VSIENLCLPENLFVSLEYKIAQNEVMGRVTSIESINVDAGRNCLEKCHCHSVPGRPNEVFLHSMV